MSKHSDRCEKDFRIFQSAQKWALANKIPMNARTLISSMSESNQVYQIRKALLQAGYANLVTNLRESFGIWQCPKPNPLAAVFYGITNPNIILRCEVCHEKLYRVKTQFCSNLCAKKSQSSKMVVAIKRWRSEQTAEERGVHQENIRLAHLAKYGFNSANQSPEGKAKIRAGHAKLTEKEKSAAIRKRQMTLTLKHGYYVANPMDIPEIRESARLNCIIAYKERGYEINAKKQKTTMSRHGVTHQIHLDSIRKRIFKTYDITINGKSYICQGYEHYMLEHLSMNGYTVSTKASGIKYVDKNGSSRRYYPDIKAVKGERKLVVEVKSEYTFNWTKTNCPEKLFSGTKYALSNNADYLVCIIYPKENYFKLIVNPLKQKDLSVKRAQSEELKSFL